MTAKYEDLEDTQRKNSTWICDSRDRGKDWPGGLDLVVSACLWNLKEHGCPCQADSCGVRTEEGGGKSLGRNIVLEDGEAKEAAQVRE